VFYADCEGSVRRGPGALETVSASQLLASNIVEYFQRMRTSLILKQAVMRGTTRLLSF
jgi:hypothetical protein